jgi:hypothetical protein
MPKPFDELTKVLQDAAYVGIGLGVIAFQKAQVQRHELTKSLQGAVDDARTAVEDNLKLIEERLRSVADR